MIIFNNGIYPASSNFDFTMNKKDLHIAPICINKNISYRISYKCLKCGRENVVFVRCDYTFVPKFVEILNKVQSFCSCNESIFTQRFHGVTYHLYPDTLMRYTLAYKPEKVSRVYLTYNKEMAKAYDPNSEISPKALNVLNSCTKINNSLSQWIDSFKSMDKILLQSENKPVSNLVATVKIKLGDVFYSKTKTICEHHFYKVVVIGPNEIAIKCTECNQEKYIQKSAFISDFKYAYHSNIIDKPKSIQMKDKASPNPLITKKKISSIDVIVLSTSKKCSEFNHSIVDYIGILPVFVNGQCKNIEINIGYCKQCDKYIMLSSDYIRICGTPICEVRDQTTGKIYNKASDIYGFNSTESVLHSYGYNVRSGNGLSSIDRRNILINILKNGICSKNEIISHLDYCINMASGKSNMTAAIHKWESDLQFVRDYKTNTERVPIGSITLKYNKVK